MMRVFRDEPHDIPIFHEVRYYRKFTGDPYKGQNVFVLKPFPRDYLSSKQLRILVSYLFCMDRPGNILCIVFEGLPPHE